MTGEAIGHMGRGASGVLGLLLLSLKGPLTGELLITHVDFCLLIIPLLLFVQISF